MSGAAWNVTQQGRVALSICTLPRKEDILSCQEREMCRLFGFRSAVTSKAHRSLIAAQNSLSHQARQHQHGWGIGYFTGDTAVIEQSITPASECSQFRRASQEVASQTMIVHVRKATVGSIVEENLHPFRYGRWLFAHNGTLYGFAQLQPHLRAQAWPHTQARGTTDSETFFHFLLGQLADAGLDPEGVDEVDVQRLAQTIWQALAKIRALSEQLGLQPPVMNFLMSNGQLLLGNRSGRELWLSTQKYYCRDAQHCQEPNKVCLLPQRPNARVNHLLLASERIGDEDHWEEVPEGSMVILSKDFTLFPFQGVTNP